MSVHENSSTFSTDESMSDDSLLHDSNGSSTSGDDLEFSDEDEDINVNNSYESESDIFFVRRKCSCHYCCDEDDDEDEYDEEPAVLTASKSNDLKTVQSYINSGSDINERINNTTCLHEAVKQGYAEMVELLLDSGAKLGSLDSCGYGPLHVAIQIKNRKIRWNMVQLLMKAGASVADRYHSYQGSSCSTTCIHEAVRINDYYLVLFLLNAGAEINCFDRHDIQSGITPLQVALSLKGQTRYDMVKKLIAAGSDVKFCYNGYTCLHTAVMQKTCSWELMKLLLDAGAELNCLSKEKFSPLALATKMNHLNLVKNMLSAGADANLSKCCSNSPLEFAVVHGHKNIVNLLLKNGADVNASDDNGRSILYCAVSEYCRKHFVEKETDILRMILAYGAVMNNPKLGIISPFKLLLRNGDIEAVQLFIEYGLKLKNCGVKFPLHEAAVNQEEGILNYLLSSHLFDVDEIDDHGSTALLIAVHYEKIDNVRLLLEWGANGNIACVEKKGSMPLTDVGRTSLGEAFATGNSKLGKLLLAAGTSLDLSDENSDIQCIIDRVFESTEETACLNCFIEYIVLSKSQGHKFDKASRRYLRRKIPFISSFIKECKRELKLLKKKVFFRHLTLYDLLLGKDITPYIGNVHVKKNFESLEVDERFPHYGEQIKEYYSLSCLKSELTYAALRGLRRIFGFRFCGDEIFSSIMRELSIKDLRNLNAI